MDPINHASMPTPESLPLDPPTETAFVAPARREVVLREPAEPGPVDPFARAPSPPRVDAVGSLPFPFAPGIVVELPAALVDGGEVTGGGVAAAGSAIANSTWSAGTAAL